MRSKATLLFCVTLALQSCASAPNVPEAPAKPPSSDSQTSAPAQSNPFAELTIAELERRAADGDTKAQAELGGRYGRGDGVEPDYGKAIEILRDAAEKGEPQAEFYLGTAYYSGLGVEHSEAQAVMWFERAAEKGHAPAQYWLAVLIKDGRGGVSPSWEGAVPLLWKSAMQGYTDAEFLLGYAYQTGSGVDQNYEAAAYWYRRTLSRADNVRALFNLALLIRNGHVEWKPGDPEKLKPDGVDAS